MTSARRDPDAIKDDLASGDAERIRSGLAGLRELTSTGDEFALPALEPWLLQPFGASPPEEAVIDLARLLARYRSFVPPPSRQHVLRQLVELAVRHAVPQVIHETSIEIRGRDDPAAAARDAIDYLRARGLATPREIEAAEALIGHLLEARPPVGRAAAEALAAWSPTDTKAAIVSAVLPLVDPDQRPLLENPPERTRMTLPPMKFEDVAVNRQERYSLGIERNSGKYYVSIPANNGIIDYEEYYEIDKDMFDRFRADLDSALPFVIRARNRQEDPRLMYQPSTRRGTPT
jgi:hypothetical protein